MRVRGFPFDDERRGVPRRARDESSSSSRTATPSCATLLIARDPGHQGEAASRCSSTAASRCQRRHVVDGHRTAEAGGTSQCAIASNDRRSPHPQPREPNDARPRRPRLRGRDVDALRGLRPRLGHRRDRARVLRAVDPAAHGRQALRHRLLVEDADLLRERRARLQLGARPHAGDRDRRRPPPTARSPTSASRATATRCRSGSASCCHAIRRNLNMLYVIENNGVYGLTKGQFSASADLGSKSKRGEAEPDSAHRSGAAGAEPRRHLRRAQLLGRQGAARADAEGGPRATRASRSSTSSRPA